MKELIKKTTNNTNNKSYNIIENKRTELYIKSYKKIKKILKNTKKNINSSTNEYREMLYEINNIIEETERMVESGPTLSSDFYSVEYIEQALVTKLNYLEQKLTKTIDQAKNNKKSA